MQGMEGVLTVLLTFGTILVVLLGGIFLWALKILKGGRPPKQLQEEETRLMQEIYQGLSRMDQRVEALEAILLDREKRGTRRDKDERSF